MPAEFNTAYIEYAKDVKSYFDSLNKLKSSMDSMRIDESKLGVQCSMKKELSIDYVHQLLLEDRAEIINSNIASLERARILMQNTDAIADLLQLKMHYEQQIEEQACESINAELEKGEYAAKLLAEHLIHMGSCGTSFDVEVGGGVFKITIEQTN